MRTGLFAVAALALGGAACGSRTSVLEGNVGSDGGIRDVASAPPDAGPQDSGPVEDASGPSVDGASETGPLDASDVCTPEGLTPSGGGPCAPGEPSCDGDCLNGRCLATLATRPSAPAGISVDATSIYWIEDNDTGSLVLRLPVAGGKPTTLAEDPHVSQGYRGVLPVAVDATDVYWGTLAAGAVKKVPLSGGASLAIGPAGDIHHTYWPASSVVLDATNVYWIGAFNNGPTIFSAPKDGGTFAMLFHEGEQFLDYRPRGLNGLAVQGGTVYWTSCLDCGTDDGIVASVPVGGGAITTMATGLYGPGAVASDATTLYWVETGPGPRNHERGYVKSIPLVGGTPTTLASGQRQPFSIAVDDISVYWGNQGGRCNALSSVPKGGGAITSLVSGPNGQGAIPTIASIAVDGTSAYWTDEFNLVVRKLTPK